MAGWYLGEKRQRTMCHIISAAQQKLVCYLKEKQSRGPKQGCA